VQNALKEKLLRFKEDEELLQSILRDYKIPVMVLDKNCKIININDKTKKLLRKNYLFQEGVSWLDFCRENKFIMDSALDSFCLKDNANVDSFKITVSNDVAVDVVVEWNVMSFMYYQILIGKILSQHNIKQLLDPKEVSFDTKTTADPLSIAIAERFSALADEIVDRSVLESFLKQIVNSVNNQGNLKNANFEYLTLSKKSRKILGINNVRDVIGKKVDVLGSLPLKYIHQIQEIDEVVAKTKKVKVGIKGEPFLDFEGKVRQLSITKIPLLDKEGNMVFLLTLAINAETLQEPTQVRKFYRLLYRSSKTAHLMFLKHYGFDQYKHPDTQMTLTEREMDVLLLLTKSNNADLVARQLNLRTGTVRNHILSVREKMNCSNKLDLVRKTLSMISEVNIPDCQSN
jgi:DNA-binding CsgD family transcriptional regulator